MAMTEQNSLPWHRRGPRQDTLPPGRAPSRARLVGRDRVPLRVFLRRTAWDAIDELVAAHVPPGESGGLLLGRAYRDDEGPFILVEHALAASHASPVLAPFRFGQQDWDLFRAQWRKMGAKHLVVGWFHTHPGYGARPTTYDRLLAERHFPEWWQLTYIIDPVQLRQGMFYWQDGELTPLGGFWVYEDEAVATAGTASSSGVVSGHRGRAATAAGLIALLLLGALALLPSVPGSLPALRTALAEHEAEAAQLAAELENVRTRHAALEQVLVALRAQPPPAVATAADAATPALSPAPPTSPANETLPVPTGPTATPTAQASGSVVPGSTGVAVGASSRELRYVVREGDTLWHISGQLLGNPLAYPSLADLNRIADPDLILPGWELRIPSEAGAADEASGR
ncbi:MAG: hypothetical protein BAA04_07125 [Firmicutes bacterium ZCTH02-B6]|nr:MAG: hypothetical protein BAA04_07125 [Firmicutes bacterium ZCTH02-B6]